MKRTASTPLEASLSRSSRAPRRQKPATAENATLTTYSIRLSGTERAELEKALKSTGWTATYFITRATIEKVAHILNVRGPSSFPFEDQARLLALLLCRSKPKLQPFEEGAPWEPNLADLLNEPENYFESDPPNRTAGDLQLLRRAVHLGGSEFMAKVLDECDRLVAPQQHSDLPAPIDPDKLG